MPTEILRPNGVGYYQEFETLVDTTHYGATSDETDSTYIQTQTEGRRDIQALQDPTFGDADIINSVTIYCRAYAIGSKGPERIDFWDRLNTTDRDQANGIAVTRDSWNQYDSGALTTAPDGGGWTKQKITDLQVGIEASALGGGETMRISEIWMVVDYTPSAGYRKLQYVTEPPTTGAFNKLKFISEPPVPGAWNKLAFEGE